MLQLLAGKETGEGSVRFKRHRPEQTRLYRLIEQYYPDFETQWAYEGRVLPHSVRREFNASDGGQEVVLVHYTRVKSLLPQMPAPS